MHMYEPRIRLHHFHSEREKSRRTSLTEAIDRLLVSTKSSAIPNSSLHHMRHLAKAFPILVSGILSPYQRQLKANCDVLVSKSLHPNFSNLTISLSRQLFNSS